MAILALPSLAGWLVVVSPGGQRVPTWMVCDSLRTRRRLANSRQVEAGEGRCAP